MKKISAKKISVYSLLTAAALLFGYVEYLVPLNFIAPGVKIGVANAVVLLLILRGEPTAAFFVNVVRIILSALLFATPFSLLFSLTAGIISTFVMVVAGRIKWFGVIGVSIFGSIIHNLTQLSVAHFTVGDGVWFYTPFLLIAGMLAGFAVGFLVWMILKRFDKQKENF